MRIERQFEVPAPPADAYGLLIDLERVGRCVPGGEVGPSEHDGVHPVSIAIRLGPMRMTYRGKVQIEEADAAARRAVLDADVRDQRGQGTAKAKMAMAVREAGTGSLVETVADMKLTGRAAQMGRGVVDDVADRLIGEMADCIAARLSSGPGIGNGTAAGAAGEAKPVGGLRLIAHVLWERLKRVLPRLARELRRRGGDTHE